MINLFNWSISIPNLSQFLAIMLTGVNLLVLFIVLEKYKMINKLLHYMFMFFGAQVAFCFIWRLICEDRINNFYDLWHTIIHLDSMYDVIAFNIIFLIIIFYKFRLLENWIQAFCKNVVKVIETTTYNDF